MTWPVTRPRIRRSSHPVVDIPFPLVVGARSKSFHAKTSNPLFHQLIHKEVYFANPTFFFFFL